MDTLDQLLESITIGGEKIFVRFKQHINNAENELNEHYLFAASFMDKLFCAMNGDDVDKNMLYYKWANFIADHFNVDYNNFLSHYMSKNYINPFMLATLLKHGADITAKYSEDDDKTRFEFLAETREVMDMLMPYATQDKDFEYARLATDYNFRMAYHAKEGSTRALDNLLNEFVDKARQLDKLPEVPINFLNPANQEQE